MKYERGFYQIRSNDEIFDKLIKEREVYEHYKLPYQDISDISKYAESISQKSIVVVGIGGSSLGAKAIYEFLLNHQHRTRNLYFLDTVDPQKISKCINTLSIKDAHFLIISKSGITIEPISIFSYLSSFVKICPKNFTFITSLTSPLAKFALAKKIKVFDIPNNLSGRFSIFGNAGLVPLAMVGINISNLLNGCREIDESFFNKSEHFEIIFNKARFLVENKSRFNINILFSYSESLKSFNDWYSQLWAESLGKKNINETRQALTPIGLIGPTDQHSFLQLIMDGVRDKTVTFIKINDHGQKSAISAIEENNDLNEIIQFPSHLNFNDLINLQAESTIESLKREKDIPYDVITIENVSEESIAKLIYSYQILVSCIGAFLQIDTYNQPGVEIGKNILKRKLDQLI